VLRPAWGGDPCGVRALAALLCGLRRCEMLSPHRRSPCRSLTENEKTGGPLDYKQTGLYSSGMGRTRETSEARRRILETADRLFYRDGIRAVGIDRIIAEAGVAKMSLYKHFPSKDDLILAVLQHREQGVLEFFRSAMERHGKKAKTPLRA